jgi:hypothetical protein
MRFKLICRNWNEAHVSFSVFDRKGINRGDITLATEDVLEFVRDDWRGNIDWDGKLPKREFVVLNTQLKARPLDVEDTYFNPNPPSSGFVSNRKKAYEY